MSNRTLIEINHDNWGYIELEPRQFAAALTEYLRSGSPENADRLRRYGIRVFGMRHHSDSFDIQWGGIKATERRPESCSHLSRTHHTGGWICPDCGARGPVV